MKINQILSLSVFLLVASFHACNKPLKQKETVSELKTEQPNVIVILLDDAGYIDFGFMGSEDLQTPHIDEFAISGTAFTDAHVTATVCAPSRAGLLTGQYQQRFGFEANHTGDAQSGDIGLADEVYTIADVFKKHDYSTIAIGKWHLGEKQSDHPNQRGFDEFYGFIAGGRSYFPMANPSKNHMLQNNGEKVEFEGYLTDILGEKSVEFVEEHKDHPFFMYLSYNAVHTPMEAKEEHLDKFENHPRQVLAAMTWSLDENIGKLTQKLDELGIREQTLIFFLSDNGPAHNNNASSGYLKGWKGNKFEGGHRIPFVVSWPGQLEGHQKFDGLTSSLDIFKTSLAAAEIETQDTLTLDGVNLLPFLKHQKQGNPHKELYWRKLDESAARQHNYKLVQLDGFGSVMYDLDTDLYEMEDISNRDSLKFKDLLHNYNQWETKLMTPLWGEGEEWESLTYDVQKRLMQNRATPYKSPSERKRHQQKAKAIESLD